MYVFMDGGRGCVGGGVVGRVLVYVSEGVCAIVLGLSLVYPQ